MSLSKGAKKLKELLFDIFGKHVRLFEEYHLGEGLRLDFYLPDFYLGFEYHGRQHAEFVEHFHGSASGFREAQRRDNHKIELCSAQDIVLVVVWHDEVLSKDGLIDKCNKAKENLNPVVVRKTKSKIDPYHTEQLARAKEARRKQYLWKKKLKKELELKSK